MTEKLKIDLGALEADYFGFIVPRETGVVWRNQIGGTACGHAELEGVFVPLPETDSDDAEISDYMNDRYRITETDVIQRFLNESELSEFFEPISPLDSDCNQESSEAWVWVRVRQEQPEISMLTPFIEQFKGLPVVLVYANSD